MASRILVWGIGWVLLPACSLLGGADDESDALRARVVGTWRAAPVDTEIRRLRIVDAAMSGRPDDKQALGDLTATEEKRFAEWSTKRGAPAANMRAELRFLDSATLEFTDTQVTVRLGTDVFGPADYEVQQATEGGLRLRFDPGLGNGLEVHDIEWRGPNEGVDRVDTERHGAFSAPLGLLRQ